jgi:hypothetical protein
MNRIVLFALLLAALLTGAAFRDGGIPSAIWDAVGCEGDPNGCPEPQQPTTDAGCELDPFGHPCRPGS